MSMYHLKTVDLNLMPLFILHMTTEETEEKMCDCKTSHLLFEDERSFLSSFDLKCIGRSNRTYRHKNLLGIASITVSWKLPLNR